MQKENRFFFLFSYKYTLGISDYRMPRVKV